MISMEEKELIKRAKNHDKSAINELIIKNMGMIKKIAQDSVGMCETLEVEDLVQYGVLGIYRAIEQFDLKKDAKFSTYAFYWIRAEIYYSIKKYDRIIRYPKDVVNFLNKTTKKIEELNMKLGRSATVEEILQYIDISSEKLKEYFKLYRKVVRLDDIKIDYFDTEQNLDKEFKIELYSDSNTEKEAIDKVLVEKIFSFNYIDEREKEILYLRYFRELTFRELSDIVNISPEWVRHINNKTLEKIRKKYS